MSDFKTGFNFKEHLVSVRKTKDIIVEDIIKSAIQDLAEKMALSPFNNDWMHSSVAFTTKKEAALYETKIKEVLNETNPEINVTLDTQNFNGFSILFHIRAENLEN